MNFPIVKRMFHERSPIAVVIIIIFEMFSIFCVKKIFAIRTGIVPIFIVEQKFICDWNFSDTIFRLTVNYIEVLLV